MRFDSIASAWTYFRRRLTNAPIREALERLEQRAQRLSGQVDSLSANQTGAADQLSAIRAEFDRTVTSAAEASQRLHVELAEMRSILQAVADRQDTDRRLTEELAAARMELARLQADLLPLVGSNLAVYLTPELRPAAKPHLGASRHRIVVCSLPKAGTYFMAELLSQMGCVATQLHLSSDSFTDYRWATRKEAREEYKRFIAPLELSKSLELLLPGQFAVGHLGCSQDSRSLLAEFKKVFLYRDLRDGLVSYLRFHADTQREGPQTRTWSDLPDGPGKMLGFLDHLGDSYFNMCLPMGDWIDQSDVFKLSFEMLYGDYGVDARQEALEALHEYLAISQRPIAPDELVAKAMGRPTKTWSGRRTEREIYWNDEVEARFREFGGHELNVRLGYDHSLAQRAA
jgi:hypothetical protein